MRLKPKVAGRSREVRKKAVETQRCSEQDQALIRFSTRNLVFAQAAPLVAPK